MRYAIRVHTVILYISSPKTMNCQFYISNDSYVILTSLMVFTYHCTNTTIISELPNAKRGYNNSYMSDKYNIKYVSHMVVNHLLLFISIIYDLKFERRGNYNNNNLIM